MESRLVINGASSLLLNVLGAKHGVWYLSKIFFLHPACSKMVPMQLSSELEEEGGEE